MSYVVQCKCCGMYVGLGCDWVGRIERALRFDSREQAKVRAKTPPARVIEVRG